MEIRHIMWHNVEIEHLKKKMPKDIFEFAKIVVDKDGISITGYDQYNWSTGKTHLYVHPKIIRLSSKDCEFEAEWWGTKIKYLKNGKSKIINMLSHKVKITAKF